MLTPEERGELVAELALRPGHEKVRALLHRILVEALGAKSRDIDFEKAAPEVHGRIDALLGRTVFELKSDLRRERKDAEEGLTRYLTERERRSGEKYVGIATDGAESIAFFLKNGSLIEASGHRTNIEKPRELLGWLQSAVAIGEGLLPEPDAIRREFGRDSLTAKRALDALEKRWDDIGRTPEAQLKRALWNRFLSLAYGTAIGDEMLFLQHTYLVVVAKAMAWTAMMDRPPESASAVLHGSTFSDLGISGQSEPDFFDWMLGDTEGEKLVSQIARQADRFDLRTIEVDVLKALYESLIDPETRHDLGEYYTPDWLAARMITATVEEPLEERVMDPACGSGTFLFHAVRRVLAAAEASRLEPSEAVLRALEKVAGVDVHPVAVIFARVTYLLALLPTLRKGHPGNVALPVYLGDSLQWNRVRVAEQGEQRELLAGEDTLEILVPSIEVSKTVPRRLKEAALRFPATVAANTQLFDRVLNTMIDFGARSEPSESFTGWMRREVDGPQEDRDVLLKTYETMCRLQNEGRNHIWGYVTRNLARPIWLSSETQKADVVIGNPPWVSFRYMGAGFQQRFRTECKGAGLWVGGMIATQQDLSSYFYMRAASLYMRRAGRIALILPYAAMSRKAYKPFRRGEVASFGNVEMRLCFTTGWAFGPEVQPLFPVPCCVLFAKVQDRKTAAPLPDRIKAFSGKLPRRNATEAEATECLSESTAAWPTEASDDGGSTYRAAFRQGASLVPRRLVLVEDAPNTGKLPPNPAFPLVRGRTGRQDKKPWKDVSPPQGTVEVDFLRPVLLGESIAPFWVLATRRGVIPWNDEIGKLMVSETAGKKGYPRLAQWLRKTERCWEKYKGSSNNLTHKERIDFHKELSCQFPIAPIRVVYTKAGSNLAAAVVQDDQAVVDHKLYWAPIASSEEAEYLCAVLNSETLRAKVERYQSQGQWGARDFDKYVFNLPIPRFETGNTLHRQLARVARKAEAIAGTVDKTEGEYFIRTRQRIRGILAKSGIAHRLEVLAGKLLNQVQT